ncbi:MAG: hypothetical protein ACYC3L_03195 [Gemmatimonadaceae bacterium]
MRRFAKRLLAAVAPQWTTALLSARARAQSHRAIASWGCAPVTRQLIARFGRRVLSGPFAGLVLSPMADAEQLGPFLLGVYEDQLQDAWTEVLQRAYPQVIDIGARFGYYAVGLARRYPDASVVAFDTDWWARKAVREMIAANDTPNVEVRGFCSPAWMMRHARDGALIISDCEGYEGVLFQSDVIARLGSATLIIETHDVFAPGVSDQLRAAFAATHVVRVLGAESVPRRASLALDFLTEPEQRLALQEVHPAQLWLLCRPR